MSFGARRGSSSRRLGRRHGRRMTLIKIEVDQGNFSGVAYPVMARERARSLEDRDGDRLVLVNKSTIVLAKLELQGQNVGPVPGDRVLDGEPPEGATPEELSEMGTEIKAAPSTTGSWELELVG